MTTSSHDGPALVPILSAGRHRTPRSGACFMEFASYLAGERWSDHPACTHPALAFLARMVNDCTSDRERSRLAELIPSVIGINGNDPRVEILVALRAATSALPIASEQRQRALAVGILACRMRLEGIGHPADSELAARIDGAFAKAPLAARWGQDFIAQNVTATRDRAVSRMAESVIRVGVLGIAHACSPEADALLREVLRGAIGDCRALLGGASVEDRLAGAGALEFEEAVVARHSHNRVPEVERLLPLRRG
ncbi:hypothetical protein BKA04_000582 [Cryobacterium mesophilum]|uniref:hypothetical protein n=1 Tax=Terrimesophilobacter mesophilus TaxID=433647 RepID=UPI00157FAEB1|nr:hypothetical protein [Terrimesophilobacter mesophilus]MBB5632359.1 hypothetical protein [Terrimesophilobacter mesophilus]